MNRISKGATALLIFALTAGCAAEKVHEAGITAFDSGDYEVGLEHLAEAAKMDPGNLSYRIDVIARREAAVRKLLAAADTARANGQPQVAEADYKRVLELDRDNARAQIGLERLKADRRYAAQITRAEAALAAKQIEEADAEVRAILAEDPLYAPAVALAARIEHARGLISLTPHLRTEDNRPVTLQFRDAPTKMVFEVLARQTGLNFIFDKDVKSDAKTTIFVSQVPVEQAIDLIIAQNQLARQILSENMVMIYPSTPAKQKEYQDEIVHTFFLSHAAPKDAESMLKTVLAAKTTFVDERSGTLTLRDSPDHVRMAEKLIASLDQPESEVIMEVEILEISHTLLDQVGIDYPTSTTLTATPLSGTPPLKLSDIGKQNSNTITVSPLSVNVDLLKTVGNSNVLSSPRIRAKNKEKAKILIGDRVPVITSGTSATTGGSYSTSSVQYLEVGLTLEVQPTIHSDGDVAIKLGLEVSSIANTLNVPTGNGGTTVAYQISTRNANTLLELKDGETQVLAGLISDTESKTSNHIPGLGDLPILGRLFGSQGTNSKKNEIVLLITPHIIRAQPRPSSDSSEFWYGTELQTRSAPFVSTGGCNGVGRHRPPRIGHRGLSRFPGRGVLAERRRSKQRRRRAATARKRAARGPCVDRIERGGVFAARGCARRAYRVSPVDRGKGRGTRRGGRERRRHCVAARNGRSGNRCGSRRQAQGDSRGTGFRQGGRRDRRVGEARHRPPLGTRASPGTLRFHRAAADQRTAGRSGPERRCAEDRHAARRSAAGACRQHRGARVGRRQHRRYALSRRRGALAPVHCHPGSAAGRGRSRRRGDGGDSAENRGQQVASHGDSSAWSRIHDHRAGRYGRDRRIAGDRRDPLGAADFPARARGRAA